MHGIYTVGDLIERLQALPGTSKVTVVNVTPGKNDQHLAILGVGSVPYDEDTVMIASIELPTE